MRLAATFLIPAIALTAAAVSAGTAAPPPRTVPCDEIILPAGPPLGGESRLVLGAVAAPPAYIPQVVPTPGRRWPYWSKWGLAVRAGRGPVTISVPPPWRARAAITWGNRTAEVASLRIARCPAQGRSWGNAYAGGFFLRSRSACVPLVFGLGGRRETVRFGVGRRCG